MTRFVKGFSLAGVAVLLFLFSACDLTDMNENPNEPSEVTTPNLLTNTQNYLAETYWDDYAGGFWVRYAQYFTTNQYTDADRFDFPSARAGANNTNWSRFYLALNDLEEIKRISRESPEEVEPFGPPANQIAIAKIMQAFTWQMMTDMWGPIPFEEALQGRSDAADSVRFSPSYASQEEVYRGMLEMLTEASDSIQTGSETLASADLVYGGNMEQWQNLANALKMRVAIRMADQLPDEAQTAIEEALAAGPLENNDDNALIPFSSSAPYQNPFYENYEVDGRDDWAIPESFLGTMSETDDPRRSAYFTTVESENADDDGFNAFPYGLTEGGAQSLWQSDDFSRPSLRVRGEPSAPAFIMLYDEVLFIQAEAAERWGVGNQTAEAYYGDAIAASLERWGVSNGDYIDEVPYDNSNGWLDDLPGDDVDRVSGDLTPDDQEETWQHTLGIQKWIALYLQGMQGWSEWRRLDFQEVLQVPPPETEGDPTPGQESFGCDFALRMEYPVDEQTLNPEARQDAVDQFLGGSDDQGASLWWDVDTPTCN